MKTLRTFLAIPLLPPAREALAEVQARLRQAGADVRWEPAGKIHLTMRFLGDVTEALLPRLSPAVSAVAQETPASDLTIAGLGAFPGDREPRIVWAGAEAASWLIHLAIELEESCCSAGLAHDERPFHPHLTLGRVKGPRNSARLTEALKTVTFEPIPQRCTELLLFQSVLSPGGSVYSPYQRFPFQS